MAFTASIFVELTLIPKVFLDILYTKFYRNRVKILKNAGSLALTPVRKYLLSLHQP